jgi:prepilin-type N-terminal cleavage/methylation domain-containing protein
LNSVGFTIIELIAVIIIIGILVATVLPQINLGALSSQTSVNAAADMVASDIRYAQEWATANMTSKSITFNSSSTYTFNPASTGMDPSGQLTSVKGVPAVTASAVTFTFNSLGEPTTGGGSSVTVSGGGASIPITVTQYTGKVSYSIY